MVNLSNKATELNMKLFCWSELTLTSTKTLILRQGCHKKNKRKLQNRADEFTRKSKFSWTQNKTITSNNFSETS